MTPEDLQRIEEVTISEIALGPEGYSAIGWVTLEDGRRLRLQLDIAKDATGYMLTGAVG